MNELDITGPEARDEALIRAVRDAFGQTAATFEPLPLDADLWQRGRDERRQVRLRVLVAAAAVLVVLGSALTWTRVGDPVPADVPEGGALPRYLHVPEDRKVDDLRDDPEHSRPAGDGRPLGRVAAAFPVAEDLALVALAETGRHLLLELPDDARLLDLTMSAFSLSPDGWHLAWGQADRDGRGTGVAVLDLRTGGLSVHPSRGPDGERALPTTVVWSPDSTRLAWKASTWNVEPGQRAGDWIGTAAVDAASAPSGATATASEEEWGELVLTDDGTAYLLTATRTETWTPRTPGRPGGLLQRSASEAHGEVTVGWGAALSRDGATFVLGAGDEGDTSRTVEFRAGSRRVQHVDWPGDTLAPQHVFSTGLLGRTPQDASLIAATEMMTGEQTVHRRTVDGTVTALTSTRGAVSDLHQLSVATDLADADTVAFATPSWAREWPGWATAALVVLGVVVAGWVVARLTRTRDALPPAGAVGTDPVRARAVRSARRWRRARDVARTVSGAMDAGLVLVLAGLLAWTAWPLLPSQTVAAPGAGALPTQVHAEYETFYDSSTTSDELDLGRTGVTLLDDGSAFLTVSATDGRHRARTAPGEKPSFWGHQGEMAVALSPDGLRMAASWVDLAGTESRAGVALVDLTTGAVAEVPLTGSNERPVAVREFRWSPSGSHLAWFGNEANAVDEDGFNGLGDVRTVGVMDVSAPADHHWRVEKGNGSSAVAVDDRGTAHLLLGRRLHTFSLAAPEEPFTTRVVHDHRQEWSGAAVTPDGRFLDVGVGGALQSEALSTGVMRIALGTDDPAQRLDLPDVSSSHVSLLGHTPAGDPLVARDLGAPSRSTEVLVVRPDGADPLTELPSFSSGKVSVATELAVVDPVAFGSPDWPVSTERKVWSAVLAALLLASLTWLAARWRRSRRTGTGASARP